MQVFQGLSLVDYPESDESEDGSTNLNSLAYCDKVVRKKRRMNHCVRPSPQSPYNSNESVVEDSDDNNDYIPKLRRTKSILMDGVPDFSDALYDSNDDNTEGPSTSKSARYHKGKSCDCVPGAKGTVEGHVRSQQEDTDIPEAAMSEGEVSLTSQLACTPRESNLNQKRATQQRGKQTTVKRSWTSEECGAVQKHLRNFIIINQVPGKKDCEQCISAEPEALKNRDWRAVKFFIKNRIKAMKRKML
ncbi:uncharacterized protein LOC121655287 [Melanotaenia boesemani]|uniref:uncharacterized protein LOC121629062 n=1 Tax=Melanotaenia boesemani TaxID=1250792 RepID=UPI001C0441E4|nr:uncharacterized protein LOC121629062 [Melanotaenia boesemani]XP_041843117.1 uncharacterized protein LOC121641196 [Melanotaenia boesemani]XP_041865788.1 uncharacterized protein LOC121655287 [Melanotaenia boesemani]